MQSNFSMKRGKIVSGIVILASLQLIQFYLDEQALTVDLLVDS